MKKLSHVTSALLALLNFIASAQAENLLKNADVAYGEYLAGNVLLVIAETARIEVFPILLALKPRGLPILCIPTAIKSWKTR